ncbi:hypothetical protein [Paenibacillus sp.]|uniref:hypothetical protein n=1 Tax=Paenibacillus sp. TaxID=58172 RepID=UPI002D643CF6|nr:hypothetical protein [Paenibacillus sp.]HZG57492.1 hypothetical protein [Paenibacillus sp.]
MIRHANVDRYVFDRLLDADADARERLRTARKRAPWFTTELFADVFYCFYLPHPSEEAGTDAPPFHRWLVKTMMRQYLYALIRPRTEGAAPAAFRTALKAVLWLTAQYAEEAARRKKDRREMPALAERELPGAGEKPGAAGGAGLELGDEASKAGRKKDERSSAAKSKEATLAERMSAEQRERLQRVGYTLEEGVAEAAKRQAAADAKPLAAAEVAALRARVAELRESMRTDFVRREKWKKKLEKAEEELAGREKALQRVEAAEKATFDALDAELGAWLSGSLRDTLSEEERETKALDELIAASLRFANRRWGSELGKLRRQSYARYLEWVERLKRHPDLVEMIRDVGRGVERIARRRRDRRSRAAPDRYDELGLSGDLSHMLPSEASLLADPEYESYFLMKWLDGKLMTYSARSPSKERGQGPVVCLLDSSHSMRGAKQRLAQIFVMTFAALALSEGRDFYLLLFGAKGELVERPLYHRHPDWAAFYRLSQLAFGGGTHFDAPLRRGMQLVREARAFGDADLVMVTDGIGAVSPPVREELAALGAATALRLHTLIVGSARQHKIAPYDILGVSHTVRFAASWDGRDDASEALLLDVFGGNEKRPSREQ